jgi:hypothetical protein
VVQNLNGLLVVLKSALCAVLPFEGLLALWLDWFEVILVHFVAFLSGKPVFSFANRPEIQLEFACNGTLAHSFDIYAVNPFILYRFVTFLSWASLNVRAGGKVENTDLPLGA